MLPLDHVMISEWPQRFRCLPITVIIQSGSLSWWRHQTETFSALGLLVLCEGNPPVSGPLPKARDAELWCYIWFVPEQTVEQTTETLVTWDAIASLWRHCNANNENTRKRGRTALPSTVVVSYGVSLTIFVPETGDSHRKVIRPGYICWIIITASYCYIFLITVHIFRPIARNNNIHTNVLQITMVNTSARIYSKMCSYPHHHIWRMPIRIWMKKIHWVPMAYCT